MFELESEEKNLQTIYFILQKGSVLESKVKLEVKTIGQELQNEVLYFSVAQLHLKIQQDLYKKQFFKFCVFVKKCENSRKLHILFLIISLSAFKLHRCTIPHFKALDLLF